MEPPSQVKSNPLAVVGSDDPLSRLPRHINLGTSLRKQGWGFAVSAFKLLF